MINPIWAQDDKSIFRDSVDGSFDISKWIFDLHGFIPIISPITEPAVGYGGVLAGTYFIPKPKSEDNRFKMPDIVVGAGAYTQNKTWFLGGAYIGFWKDDHVRYRGVLGYGDINLKYYGSNSELLSKYPVSFSLETFLFLQQAIFKVKNSHFFVGGKYLLLNTNVLAFNESQFPGIRPREFQTTNSGLGLLGEYETFDNVLSPTKGIRIHLDYIQYLEQLGSDYNNGRLTLFSLGYIPISKRWVSGFRLESMLASESTPFYMKPFLSLRGVPALRYVGQFTILTETEQYYNFYKRWGVVGFAGMGTTLSSFNDSEFSPLIWNAGGGIRYKIARVLGLQMGLDVARGPESWAFYIVFGSSWNK